MFKVGDKVSRDGTEYTVLAAGPKHLVVGDSVRYCSDKNEGYTLVERNGLRFGDLYSKRGIVQGTVTRLHDVDDAWVKYTPPEFFVGDVIRQQVLGYDYLVTRVRPLMARRLNTEVSLDPERFTLVTRNPDTSD